MPSIIGHSAERLKMDGNFSVGGMLSHQLCRHIAAITPIERPIAVGMQRAKIRMMYERTASRPEDTVGLSHLVANHQLVEMHHGIERS